MAPKIKWAVPKDAQAGAAVLVRSNMSAKQRSMQKADQMKVMYAGYFGDKSTDTASMQPGSFVLSKMCPRFFCGRRRNNIFFIKDSAAYLYKLMKKYPVNLRRYCRALLKVIKGPSPTEVAKSAENQQLQRTRPLAIYHPRPTRKPFLLRCLVEKFHIAVVWEAESASEILAPVFVFGHGMEHIQFVPNRILRR